MLYLTKLYRWSIKTNKWSITSSCDLMATWCSQYSLLFCLVNKFLSADLACRTSASLMFTFYFWVIGCSIYLLILTVAIFVWHLGKGWIVGGGGICLGLGEWGRCYRSDLCLSIILVSVNISGSVIRRVRDVWERKKNT